MSTAASTWSATVWNAVVHISSRSAPAASRPARGVGQDGGDVVPATGPLELGELVELHAGHHGAGGVQAAEALLDAEVEQLVVDEAALPAHPADESDAQHARESVTAGSVRCRRSGIDLSHDRCQFVPPYLLEKIATSHPDPEASRCGAQHPADRRRRCGSPAPRHRPPHGPSPARRPHGRSPCTPPTTAPTCPATWCAPPETPRPATWRSTRPTSGSRRPWRCSPRSSAATSYDDQGRRGGRHRALREGLRQRLLGRHPAGVRRRRRHGVRPVHQAGRRARPRAHATRSPSSPPT